MSEGAGRVQGAFLPGTDQVDSQPSPTGCDSCRAQDFQNGLQDALVIQFEKKRDQRMPASKCPTLADIWTRRWCMDTPSP